MTSAALDLNSGEAWVVMTTDAPTTVLDVDTARALARMLTTTAEEAEALTTTDSASTSGRDTGGGQAP